MAEHNGAHRGFPFSTRPTGWFQLGWSAQFATGVPQALQYFGQELVAYRGESGTLQLLDAYCPHMGAHLGHGGSVIGDDLQCPFHGWRFGPDGANVDIPYSSRRQMPKRLGCWAVKELDGVAYFWHDAKGHPPRWDVTSPIGDPDRYYPLYPAGTKTWKLRLYPQFVTENGIDFSHFVYAHKAAFTPRLEWFEQVDDHTFRAQLEVIFGGHAEKTWLTPDGPVTGHLRGEFFGVGLNVARFLGTDGAVSLVAITPIDDDYSLFSMSNWVERLPGDTGDEYPDVAVRRVQEQFKQAERDHPIWEHMRYTPKAPTTPEETEAFRAMREWARRFYPGEQAYADLMHDSTTDVTISVDEPVRTTDAPS